MRKRTKIAISDHAGTGCSRRRIAAGGLAFAVAIGLAGAARASPDAIALPGAGAYPENVTAASDGTLYVSSFVDGGVLRIPPGGEGEAWIKPGAFGTRSTFGLLADENTATLWVCSNDLTALGVTGPGDAKGSALKGFDLKTGVGRASVAFPGERTICNDIALGPDGSVYATNTLSPQILRLKPGGRALDVFVSDPIFDAGPSGAGLDGIVFGSDGNLYVTTFSKGELFRVEVEGDAAGRITRLETSRPLVLADGIRLNADGTFLLVEGGGCLDRVTVTGDRAMVETLRDGLAGGPTGVAKVGDTAWISVGQLSVVLDPAKKGSKPSLPFRLVAVPLPTP